MRTVWKYTFEISDDEQVRIMPSNARPLFVEMQDFVPCLWAEVDTASKSRPFTFRIFGTGHVIPDGYEHVGTFQQPPYVWHLYNKGQ